MARRREGTAITPAVARAPCPTRWGRVRARHVPRQAARFATPNSAGVREGRGRGGVGGGRAKCASSGGGRRHALGGQSRGAGGGAGAVASRRDSGWALDGLQLGSQLDTLRRNHDVGCLAGAETGGGHGPPQGDLGGMGLPMVLPGLVLPMVPGLADRGPS